MKRCLIVIVIVFIELGRLYGQSASASIDSLIKYKVITTKDLPVLNYELKHNSNLSYRVALLGGLESVVLKNTFHIDPRQTGAVWSHEITQNHSKNQDSINRSLHLLLQNIKKAGLLTNRVFNHAIKNIDSGQYVINLQLIGDLVEMSHRFESLAPDKLLPVAEGLYKNGIIDTPSFQKLKNDILNENVESVSQLNNYCRLDRVFDLTKYPDDPNIWIERMHHDIASMLPGLTFTDFKYTLIPDTSFSLPGARLKISLICNGRLYKHTSIPFYLHTKQPERITATDVSQNDFYRLFNKILADQQSPLRFHIVMPSPTDRSEDRFNNFALILLN